MDLGSDESFPTKNFIVRFLFQNQPFHLVPFGFQLGSISTSFVDSRMVSYHFSLCLALTLSSRTVRAWNLSRATFLSSSAASFLTSAVILASDPEASCAATPRYIDSELDMNYGDGPRTRGMLVRRFTGDSTPYQFPVTPVSLVKPWPEEPPFEPRDFSREDEIDDGAFYSVPRLVNHIDEPAVASLTQYYRNTIKPKSDILDICSSCVSHYPVEF